MLQKIILYLLIFDYVLIFINNTRLTFWGTKLSRLMCLNKKCQTDNSETYTHNSNTIQIVIRFSKRAIDSSPVKYFLLYNVVVYFLYYYIVRVNILLLRRY